MENHFNEINVGTIMEIITPLLWHTVPKNITDFSEQNAYMMNNFKDLFENEYGFNPYFRLVVDNKIYIEVTDDIKQLDWFTELLPKLKKIKEKLKGFCVFIEIESTIEL